MLPKIYLSIGVLFLISIIAPFVKAATHTASIPKIEYWVTKKGVPVYFVSRTQIPIIDISVLFHAGSSQDKHSPGIAYFTAQMLDQGTQDGDADQIANHLEEVGARYNVAINQDGVIVHLRAMSPSSPFFHSAFHTFSGFLGTAYFPQKAIDRMKKQVRIALQQEAQSPPNLAAKALYKTLYGEHPYASPLLGTINHLNDISREKLLNFYRRYYVAENTVIAIVGDTTKDKAAHMAEQLAAVLPSGQKPSPLSISPSHRSFHPLQKIFYPSQQTSIILGQIGIAPKDPDYFPLILANQILGGGILTSRLFTEVRNSQGLCYGISSRFNTLNAQGPFFIQLQTRNKQAEKALSITQKTIKDFITLGPYETELKAAKQTLIAGFPLLIASNTAILSAIEKIGFYQLPLNYLDNYQANIEKVELKQVCKALKEHIKPEKMAIIMVGKMKKGTL